MLSLVMVSITSCLVAAFPTMSVVVPTRAIQGVFQSIVVPFLAAMTLGAVGSRNFTQCMTQNEAGHMAGHCILVGTSVLIFYFGGMHGIFIVIAVSAFITCVLIFLWPEIDDDRAANTMISGERVRVGEVLCNKQIMLFMFVAFTFHLGNAPQLPLVMQKISAGEDKRAALPLGACAIFIAQFGMSLTLYLAGLYCKDYHTLILVAELVVFTRCFWNAYMEGTEYMLAGQISEWVGAGIFNGFGILVLEKMARNTGRYGLCLGLWAGADKLGAAIGQITAQPIVENYGYKEGFLFCAVAGFFSFLCAVCLFYVVEEHSEKSDELIEEETSGSCESSSSSSSP